MQAVTIQVTKNEFLVTEASVSTAGAVIENQSAVRHIFANSDDLKFWLTGHLDAPVGEA